LAQDTASLEDNILFTGEMYNLKLNAGLTVLFTCETGSGKFLMLVPINLWWAYTQTSWQKRKQKTILNIYEKLN